MTPLGRLFDALRDSRFRDSQVLPNLGVLCSRIRDCSRDSLVVLEVRIHAPA